jgi:hypothetical protein
VHFPHCIVVSSRSVYCTQAYAAIAESFCAAAFTVNYVGNVSLAKNYGIQTLYQLHWGSTPAAQIIRRTLAPAVAAAVPPGVPVPVPLSPLEGGRPQPEEPEDRVASESAAATAAVAST